MSTGVHKCCSCFSIDDCWECDNCNDTICNDCLPSDNGTQLCNFCINGIDNPNAQLKTYVKQLLDSRDYKPIMKLMNNKRRIRTLVIREPIDRRYICEICCKNFQDCELDCSHKMCFECAVRRYYFDGYEVCMSCDISFGRCHTRFVNFIHIYGGNKYTLYDKVKELLQYIEKNKKVPSGKVLLSNGQCMTSFYRRMKCKDDYFYDIPQLLLKNKLFKHAHDTYWEQRKQQCAL